jgi:hypothetical protein
MYDMTDFWKNFVLPLLEHLNDLQFFFHLIQVLFNKKKTFQGHCYSTSSMYVLVQYAAPPKNGILLRGIQLTHVQRYSGSTVKIVFSYKICTFHQANTFVALPNA